jgi:hypothetical protein
VILDRDREEIVGVGEAEEEAWHGKGGEGRRRRMRRHGEAAGNRCRGQAGIPRNE